MPDDLTKKAYQVAEFPAIARGPRSQGERSTCVAFSVTSLLEYGYVLKEQLSPQYLYARCHQDPNDAAGMGFEEAFKAVRDFGVCLEKEWPYNQCARGTEGQCRPEVLDEIPTQSFRDARYVSLTTDPPSNVNEYKAVLCGASGGQPTPILVGCRIFDGLKQNAEWLSCPGSDDTEIGAHAMVIYGWQDTGSPSLSKGYFLALNSWGRGGIMRIRYEYIENYALQAGYLRRDHAVSRVADGVRSEACGARVQDLPKKSPAVQGCESSPISATEAAQGAEMTQAKDCEAFFSSQHHNLSHGPYCFPGLQLPFPESLGPFWQVDTQGLAESEAYDDCTDAFLKYVKKSGVSDLQGKVRIYRIRIHYGVYYRLVSAFLWHDSGKRGIDQADIGLLQSYVSQDYACGDNGSSPRHLFYVIGTSGDGDFQKDCEVTTDPTVILCERKKGLWCFRLPYGVGQCGLLAVEFLRHILPGDYYERVRATVASWNFLLNRNLTLGSLREALGLPGDSVTELFLAEALNQLFARKSFAMNDEGKILPAGGGELTDGFRRCRRYCRLPRQRFRRCVLVSLLCLLIVMMAVAGGCWLGIGTLVTSLGATLVVGLFGLLVMCHLLRAFQKIGG